MLKLSFFLIISMAIVSCKSEEGNKHGGYYWIYSYGYPRMEFYEAAEGISEKWKIKYHSISECMIEKKRMDNVDAKNKNTYAAIEKKYGVGWKEKYDRDIEGFMIKKVDVMDVLITNKLFRNELKKHYIEIDDVDKEVKELSDGLYKVFVYNDKLKAENKECFTVNVNTKDRTVYLIR